MGELKAFVRVRDWSSTSCGQRGSYSFSAPLQEIVLENAFVLVAAAAGLCESQLPNHQLTLELDQRAAAANMSCDSG